MTLVADASVLIAALIESDPGSEWADSMIRSDSLDGPEIVAVEVTNVLRRMELRGEISTGHADRARRILNALDLRTHPFAPYAERVWALRHNLTAYDAWYVAVAEALGCPLATLDLRLSHAPGPTCEVLAPP